MRRVPLAIAGVPALALLGLVMVPTAGSAGDGLAPAADITKVNTSASGIDDRVGAQLPMDLVLRDEQENQVTLGSCIDGKPTILVPMYYRCPMLCNLVLQGLVKTLREMPQDFTAGNQFNVVAISFDPLEHGDLATAKKQVVLQEYGRPGAEKGWHFLTGGPNSKETIKELMAVIGYRYEFDKSFKEYNHPTGIITVTPSGKIARYFYGVTYDGEFEVPGGKTTLRLSLVEASEGKVGSLLDKLYLGCYRFDHMKGYSLNVLRAVQIGGILTLLVVGTWLFFTFRRGGVGRATGGNTQLTPNQTENVENTQVLLPSPSGRGEHVSGGTL